MKTIEEFNFKNNSFTLIRYFAAFQVLYGHIVAHLDIPNSFQLLNSFSGVPIFFCLSGYLISNTLSNSKLTKKNYIVNRFLRIYPELWIAILVNAIVLVIFNPKLINNFQFWLFNITQATFMQFWTPNCLRNYGVGTPNGALWTITIFIQFYIVVYIVYPWLKKFKFKHHMIILFISIIPNILFVYLEPFIPETLFKLFNQTLIPYWFIFYIGIIIFLYKEKIVPVLIKNYYIILILFVLYSLYFNIIPSIYMDPLRVSLLCLLTIAFGYKFSKIRIKKDYSFGIYIYHMIIINILVETKYLYKNPAAIIVVIVLLSILSIFSRNIVNSIMHKYLNKFKN